MPGADNTQDACFTTAETLSAFKETPLIEEKETATDDGSSLEKFQLSPEELASLQGLHPICFADEALQKKTFNKGCHLTEELRVLLLKLDVLETQVDQKKNASDEYKRQINQYRSAILKIFENHLLALLKKRSPEKPEEPLVTWKYVLHYLGYGFLLLVGMIMDGIGSFLGGQQLLQLLPTISGPLGMALGIIFSVINAALFYSFEAAMLKEAVGLKSMDEIGKKLKMDQEQIESAEKINELLEKEGRHQLDLKTYKAYTALAEQINATISAKTHLNAKELPEKTLKKILRHAVTGIGALMVCGYGYFMVNSLLIFLAPALLGTPLGWALIGIGVITMLAYYLSMRGKAMVKMLNPASQKFKDAQKQYKQFEGRSKPEFEKIYAEKSEMASLKMTCEKQKEALKTAKDKRSCLKAKMAKLKERNTVLERAIEEKNTPPATTPVSTTDLTEKVSASSTMIGLFSPETPTPTKPHAEPNPESDQPTVSVTSGVVA